MKDPLHHRRFVCAIKLHWRNAGGPVSLTSFLKECRPTIAPLLARNIPWEWIGSRLLAVYEKPYDGVPDEPAPLGTRKKSLIELYSRTTRHQKTGHAQAALGATWQSISDAPGDSAGFKVKLEPSPPFSFVASAPRTGADPPAGRRARIRQSGKVRQSLEQSE
jgi:hypothetical protein